MKVDWTVLLNHRFASQSDSSGPFRLACHHQLGQNLPNSTRFWQNQQSVLTYSLTPHDTASNPYQKINKVISNGEIIMWIQWCPCSTKFKSVQPNNVIEWMNKLVLLRYAVRGKRLYIIRITIYNITCLYKQKFHKAKNKLDTKLKLLARDIDVNNC